MPATARRTVAPVAGQFELMLGLPLAVDGQLDLIAAVNDALDAPARTVTGTFLGSCSGGCGPVRTDEKFVRHSCGAWITNYRPIKAATTEHACGPRCTSALGPSCDCTCGGRNHAADHR